MKRKPCTPSEIVESLNRAEQMRQSGRSITLVCRELGISRPTYNRWKQEYRPDAQPGRRVGTLCPGTATASPAVAGACRKW